MSAPLRKHSRRASCPHAAGTGPAYRSASCASASHKSLAPRPLPARHPRPQCVRRLLPACAPAGAGPWPHAKIDGIHKSQRVEPQHGRINPTVDRNVRRAQRGWHADKCRPAESRSNCTAPSGAPGCSAARGGHQEKPCQHRRAQQAGGMAQRLLTFIPTLYHPDGTLRRPGKRRL